MNENGSMAAPQVVKTSRQRPAVSPVNPKPDSILRLQQSMGNQAVSRLLSAGRVQPQSKATQPGAETERESDRASQGVEAAMQSQAEAAAASVILDDGAATVGPGHMKRADFLAALEQALCTVADNRLAAVGRTAKECPYLHYIFRFYAAKDVDQLRRAILRHAPETEHATTAGEYIALLSQRVGIAVDTWVATGRIMWRAHGIEAPDDPAVAQAELGPGSALDAGIRAKAESAMQEDLSGVRVHTGDAAASMTGRLGARAVTVGQDVAFAAGEYRPGTPVGDAMIAHELAHVVQQKDSGAAAPQHVEAPALEGEADEAAAGIVMSIWGAAKGAVADVARKVKPALRTGLRLQSCHSEKGPLKFVLAGFTMDADGSLQTGEVDMPEMKGDFADKGFSPGKALHVFTKDITSVASAYATGGTNLEASAWQVGYLQTVFKAKRTATYARRRGLATPTGSPPAAAEKVWIGESLKPMRDSVTDHVVDLPWYNDTPLDLGRFDKTEQRRGAEFLDKPQLYQPTQTLDGYDLSRISGQDKFGTWFVAAKAAGGTPYFLKSATWEVNWATDVTVSADGTPTATPSGGSKMTHDPISDSGANGPQLTGSVANDIFVAKWKTP